MTKPAQDNGSRAEGSLFSDERPTLGEHLPKMGTQLIENAKKFSERLHKWMASVAIHVALHGDVTEATRVVKELDAVHIRTNGIKAWFESEKAGATMVWDTEAKAFVFNKAGAAKLKKRYESNESDCYKALVATKLGDVSKEALYKGFELRKVLKRALKESDKIMADPTKKAHKDTDIDVELLASLRALLNGAPATETIQ